MGDFIGGGGGGAGGVLSGTYTITAGQTYNIKVGSGGVGGLKSSNATTRKGNPGVYSQFGNIVANGGGAGGGLDEIGGTGASGGGAGGSADIILNPGGARIIGQGYSGGYSSVASDFLFPYKAAGGGGGGAGGAGANAADQKTQVMEVLVSSLLLPELPFITVAAVAVALEISKAFYGLIYQ